MTSLQLRRGYPRKSVVGVRTNDVEAGWHRRLYTLACCGHLPFYQQLQLLFDEMQFAQMHCRRKEYCAVRDEDSIRTSTARRTNCGKCMRPNVAIYSNLQCPRSSAQNYAGLRHSELCPSPFKSLGKRKFLKLQWLYCPLTKNNSSAGMNTSSS